LAEHQAIRPRPGFDWTSVGWEGADETPGEVCSYCGDAIGEDAVPLMLWNRDGWGARFCDHCQATWFGMQSFDERRIPMPEPEAAPASTEPTPPGQAIVRLLDGPNTPGEAALLRLQQMATAFDHGQLAGVDDETRDGLAAWRRGAQEILDKAKEIGANTRFTPAEVTPAMLEAGAVLMLALDADAGLWAQALRAEQAPARAYVAQRIADGVAITALAIAMVVEAGDVLQMALGAAGGSIPRAYAMAADHLREAMLGDQTGAVAASDAGALARIAEIIDEWPHAEIGDRAWLLGRIYALAKGKPEDWRP
jgi:hypothetical protein